MLYMFQAVPPPIIKSSNYIYSIGYFVKEMDFHLFHDSGR